MNNKKATLLLAYNFNKDGTEKDEPKFHEIGSASIYKNIEPADNKDDIRPNIFLEINGENGDLAIQITRDSILVIRNKETFLIDDSENDIVKTTKALDSLCSSQSKLIDGQEEIISSQTRMMEIQAEIIGNKIKIIDNQQKIIDAQKKLINNQA